MRVARSTALCRRSRFGHSGQGAVGRDLDSMCPIAAAAERARVGSGAALRFVVPVAGRVPGHARTKARDGRPPRLAGGELSGQIQATRSSAVSSAAANFCSTFHKLGVKAEFPVSGSLCPAVGPLNYIEHGLEKSTQKQCNGA